MLGEWLTADESAIVLGCHVRHAQLAAKRENWRFREEPVRGGKRKLYARQDVLAYARSKGLSVPDLEPADPTPAPVISGVHADAFLSISAGAREEVERRLACLLAWEEWRSRAGTPRAERRSAESDNEFVRQWVAQHPGARVSRATLHRWRAEYQDRGVNGLISGYHLRDSSRGPAIDTRLVNLFDALYLHQNHRSVAVCWEHVSIHAQQIGVKCPSLRTFHRYADEIPVGTKILCRDGETAWRNKCGPYMRKDLDTVASGQVYVGDHHQLDLWCIGEDGQLMRPWVTAWFDLRSTTCVGIAVSDSPNSTTIFQAMKRALEDYGLPAEIYIDNGKDYRSKDFAGGREVTRTVKVDAAPAKMHSLVGRLGITPHFAIPYNARAKIAERMFLILKEHFSKMWESYCGGSIAERPERLQSLVKRRDGLPTFLDVEDALNGWFKHVFNHMPLKHEGGKTREEVWQLHLANERRTALPETLALLCMRSKGPLTVGRDGIRVFDQFFDDPALDAVRHQKVLVNYDPQNISRIWVTDLTGVVVATVSHDGLAAWGGGEQQYRAFARAEKGRKARAKRVLSDEAVELAGGALQAAIEKGRREAAEKAAAQAAAAADAAAAAKPGRVYRPVEMELRQQGDRWLDSAKEQGRLVANGGVIDSSVEDRETMAKRAMAAMGRVLELRRTQTPHGGTEA